MNVSNNIESSQNCHSFSVETTKSNLKTYPAWCYFDFCFKNPSRSPANVEKVNYLLFYNFNELKNRANG